MRKFLSTNWELYEKSGIPVSLVEDLRAWGYFLDHGEAHWLRFRVEDISSEQAPAFVEFVARYLSETGEDYSLSFDATGLDRRVRDRVAALR